MGEFVVYCHIRLDTSTIFYVGMGLPDRPYSTGGRNKYWRKVIAETAYTVAILHRAQSAREAREVEKHYIALFAPTLTNVVDAETYGKTERKRASTQLKQLRKELARKRKELETEKLRAEQERHARRREKHRPTTYRDFMKPR